MLERLFNALRLRLKRTSNMPLLLVPRRCFTSFCCAGRWITKLQRRAVLVGVIAMAIPSSDTHPLFGSFCSKQGDELAGSKCLFTLLKATVTETAKRIKDFQRIILARSSNIAVSPLCDQYVENPDPIAIGYWAMDFKKTSKHM